MAESMSEPITHCPWCSVLLPTPGATTCPECGAALSAVPNAPAEIRGVTTLDTEAILRARSSVSPPRGSRLLSFITGEIPVDTSTPAAADAFAPPSEEVRREMRRLQIDAQQADLVAEVVALKSDELTRRGIHISELEGDEAVTGPAASPPSPDAEPEGAPTVDAEAAPEGGWPAELTPDAVEPAPEREPGTEPESRD
jgi:hypothetical protein